MAIRLTVLTAAILAFSITLSSAFAERPHQDRATADHVIEGVVTGVYHRAEGPYQKYIVEMRVSNPIKGDDVHAGDLFRAYCFQGPKDGFFMGASGHLLIPVVGSKVRVFVNHESGLNEGVYPKWIDVLENAMPVDNSGLEPVERSHQHGHTGAVPQSPASN